MAVLTFGAEWVLLMSSLIGSGVLVVRFFSVVVSPWLVSTVGWMLVASVCSFSIVCCVLAVVLVVLLRLSCSSSEISCCCVLLWMLCMSCLCFLVAVVTIRARDVVISLVCWCFSCLVMLWNTTMVLWFFLVLIGVEM